MSEQRELVSAFLTALRGGNFEGLLAVLDPNLVVHVDEAGAHPGASREIRRAPNWVKRGSGTLSDGALGRTYADQRCGRTCLGSARKSIEGAGLLY